MRKLRRLFSLQVCRVVRCRMVFPLHIRNCWMGRRACPITFGHPDQFYTSRKVKRFEYISPCEYQDFEGKQHMQPVEAQGCFGGDSIPALRRRCKSASTCHGKNMLGRDEHLQRTSKSSQSSANQPSRAYVCNGMSIITEKKEVARITCGCEPTRDRQTFCNPRLSERRL